MSRLLRSLIGLSPLLLSACAEPGSPGVVPPAILKGEAPRDVLAQRWRDQAADLLVDPRRIAPPYSDQGTFLAHEAEGRAYVFAALEGQTLDVELARAAVVERADDDGPIIVDLYRVAWRGAKRRLVRVQGVSLDPGRIRVRLPHSADYVLRLQPAFLVNAHFGLRLELSAALAFPVPGRDLAAVRSFFGDDRDGGARLHEGVDIFAPRSTPIVAVADGRAVPRQNDLGGNVVYLNTAGISYYYAHLEHASMDRPRRVRAGEVLGFIGNSGNAVDTPPHLHFGIYDWGAGRGAVDPMPHLTAHRFDEPPDMLLTPVVTGRALASDRLARSVQGTIVWVPEPAGMPELTRSGERLGVAVSGGRIDPVRAFEQRQLDRVLVSLNGDTAALGRGIAVASQLQYGLRP